MNARRLIQEVLTDDDARDVVDSADRAPDELVLARRLTLAESMLAAIPAFVYVFNLREGVYIRSNGDLRAFLGFTDAASAALTDSEFSAMIAHPEDSARYLDMLAEHRQILPGQRLTRRVRLRAGSGVYRWFQHTLVGLTFDDNGVVETLGTLDDVTDVVETTDRLHDSERRFRELFHRSPAGTVVIDDDGTILEANDAMALLVGIACEDLLGTSYDLLVHPEERHEVAKRRATMRGTDNAASQAHRRLLHSDGDVRWVQVLITRIRESDRWVTLLAFDDVTAERAAKEQLEHAALHDSLTGLPNRRLLQDRLGQAVARSARTGAMTAVLFLDLDRVKSINDTFGHAVGDAVLAHIAHRLETVVRAADTVSRVGGDEFVVVCDDIGGHEQVTALADRILRLIAEPLAVDDAVGTIRVTASIGIATTTGDATADELVRAADMAMYEAKGAGRDRMVLASPTA